MCSQSQSQKNREISPHIFSCFLFYADEFLVPDSRNSIGKLDMEKVINEIVIINIWLCLELIILQLNNFYFYFGAVNTD